MKFENSLFEERYNDYWNRTVVVLDTTIRNSSSDQNLFANRANVGELIKTYQQNVLNVLSNLDRQSLMFEDEEYVQKYRKNTIEQAREDLTFYANLFPEYKNISSEALKAIDKDTSLITDETRSFTYTK
ncbi:bile acid beta-glucosidase [Legionella steigerwaltii]|uniref:Bile acid beta-glucosidase n=1 Tax=Legionella steigerwaltii TaxID=460 RepID=A0A378LA73_9GAMM|nr:hypothetical protein [Legionella steigerwaltii]KTD81082.1 bile acid beta-glucosidase [Legionella steigerwaltii]STY23230.1 bile acid beta-glucosidase [Legionella steigerwaltii]